ncbi:MAG: hypothetical protein QMD13_02220 [Candidatus Bathyarchaeia archaeon]|nr:hypothetical protein [Candidatus Bathyarchaeia archaeon]
MVEKRSLVFATLATIVWAVSISSLAAYFYLQNATYSEQIAENQQSLNTMAVNYNEAMTKRNTLLSEYSMLYGNYSFPLGTNFTLLTKLFNILMDNLKGNYSYLLMNQKDLNETYHALLNQTITINQKGNVTREEFGELLNEFYELFNLLAIRELSRIISETVTLTASICIIYENGTEKWHNKTSIPTGSSLFQLTQKIAKVNYTYSAWMKPGHIRLTAINDETEYTEYKTGYSEGRAWIWYYWDDNKQEWLSGPVGCDAWMLKDEDIYKWNFEYWRWP